MSSHLFHSHTPAAVMSSEEVPTVLKSEPFSPLPDVSPNTIFPQQPIPTLLNTIPSPRPASTLAPPSHSPSLSSGYATGEPQRSFICGAYAYENPWVCFQRSYIGSPAFLGSDQFRRAYRGGRGISRYGLVNLANIRTERCSAEERKEKIAKYRAKRRLRNFNKTIKWLTACREFEGDLHAVMRFEECLDRQLPETGMMPWLRSGMIEGHTAP